MLSRLALARPALNIYKNKISPNTYTAARNDFVRLFNNDAREKVGLMGRRVTRRTTLKESLSKPTTGLPFAYGQAFALGSAAIGLGALCFYGAGLGSQAGTWERSLGWDEIVRQRVSATYMYFGSSIAVTAASAAAVFRSPTLLNLASRSSIPAMLLTMAAVIGSGILCQSIPYQDGFGAKQATWLLHTALVGGMIAPLAFVGGQVILRAAFMTAGIVGGLSAVAASAPSEKFLTWGGPLAIGLGAVFASSIAGMFLPPTTALGAGIHSFVLYGGLVLFGAFLLYDTQKIFKKAETHPINAVMPFDPINASIGIYLDTVNIFIRMVMILSGGGSKKR